MKRSFFAFFIFFGLNFLLLGFKNADNLHPIHLTNTVVNYKPSEKTLQLTVHFFCDDVEFEIQQMGKPNLRLNSPYENAKSNEILLEYFNKYLTLKVDGKPVTLSWIGKEGDKNLQGAHAYLEVKNVKSLKTLEISNSMLIARYGDQKNIIKITKTEKDVGYLTLDKKKISETIKF
jgi:hypothetical protein